MRYFKIILMVVVVAVMGSCTSKTSYANQRKEEKTTIKNYLNRCGIKVINSLPEDSVSFGENEYYESTSGLYYHLDKPGERGQIGADTIAVGDRVVLRYKKWGLTSNSDTTSYWTTNDLAYPIEFTYSYYASYSSTTCCTAWLEAILYMRYNGAEATIIVPADLGFADDQSPTLTPYAYKLKLQFQK